MSTDPVASAKYFVVINGQPQGPHTATAIMALWNAGRLSADTLICEEGAASWVPLRQYEPILRSALPPVPPQGYAHQPAPPVHHPVVVQSDGTKVLRLGTIVGALILFFVPWMEVKCGGRPLMNQSGVRAILNTAAPDENLSSLQKTKEAPPGMPSGDMSEGKLGDKVGHSYLAGGALLAILVALGVSPSTAGRRTFGSLAAVALICLGIQAAIRFPLQKAVDEGMQEMMQKTKDRGTVVPPIAMKEMFGLTFNYTPWFYGELILLGAAAALGLSGSAPARR